MENSNQLAVVVLHTNQYAEGITGQNHYAYIYHNNDQWFDSINDKKLNKIFRACKKQYKNKVKDGLGDFYHIDTMTKEQVAEIEYRYSKTFMFD